MDALTQLFGSTFGLLLLVAVLLWMCTPLVWTYLLFRFFRDVHAIREAVEHNAYQRPRQIVDAPAAAASSVQLSAFGR